MGKITKTYHFDTNGISLEDNDNIERDVKKHKIKELNLASTQPDGSKVRVTPSQVYLESDPLRTTAGYQQSMFDRYLGPNGSSLLTTTNPSNDDATKNTGNVTHIIKKRGLVEDEKKILSSDNNMSDINFGFNPQRLVGRFIMDSIVTSGLIYLFEYERTPMGAIKEGALVSAGIGISETVGFRTWNVVNKLKASEAKPSGGG